MRDRYLRGQSSVDDERGRLRREITEMEQRYERLMEKIDETRAYQRRMDHPRDRRTIQVDVDELEDFARRYRQGLRGLRDY